MSRDAAIHDWNQVLEASFDKLVLVDFWAAWCGPCKAMKPTLEQAEVLSGNAFYLVFVNADENPELANRYNVRGLPCMVMFRNGEVYDRRDGVKTPGEIKAWIKDAMIGLI